MRTRIKKYALWLVLITHITLLGTAMQGVWGEYAAKSSRDLAEKFGKNGVVRMLLVSTIISAILTVVFGSGVLYVLHMFVRIFGLL